MRVLIISRWNDLYENAGSRKLRKLNGVLVTNSFESERYLELLQERQAPVLLSAFVQMLQVASSAMPRGALLRDNGRPHDAHSLSIKTRAPKRWFDLAIPYLQTNGNAHEPGWLASVEVANLTELARHGCYFPSDVAETPAKSASAVADHRQPNGGNTPPSVVLGSVGLDSLSEREKGQGHAFTTPPGGSWIDTMLVNERTRTLPPSHDTPEFRAAWSKWCEDLLRRVGTRKPSIVTLDQHLETLLALSVPDAIRAINHSIASIFIRPELPNANGHGHHSKSRSHPRTFGPADSSEAKLAR